MGDDQGGSPRTDLMRSGHYPRQVSAPPRIGSGNLLRQPLRYAGRSDVLRIAFIPGDAEAATGLAKRVGPPPVNPQGPDGLKSTDSLVKDTETERCVERNAKKLPTGKREGLQGCTWLSCDQ